MEASYLKGVERMNEEIREMLGEEIKTEIRNLSDLKTGSPEKSTAIDDLAKLYRLKIEETKNEMDFEEKREKRAVDIAQADGDITLRQDQLNEDVKNRYFRIGIEAAGVVLPLVFYAFWMRKGFKFEESGTFTSTTFRGLFNRFRPTK